jgi:crotonobetainyl-CoA:carnitine CoA-transferase CaiB-like acyl-CoA transferase
MTALAGIRVLDLTRYIPGPYCTLLLADLGADVVKVEEPPLGDPTRFVAPAVGQESAVHAALNRNKRSIAVDLRSEEGPELLRRMARTADVFIEGFRPGTLENRGLGPAALLQANPRLVYCSLTGYGQDGPLARRAGHDIDYVARGGLLGGLRDREGDPVLPGTQIADMTGALLATIGILAALQARERTGRGQHVDVSMLEGVLGLMTVPAARLLAGGSLVNELSGAYACYNVYRCRDGKHVAVGALEPKFWEALCRTVGLPEKASGQWEQGEARRETVAALSRLFASRDRAEWLRDLQAADCCVEPVLDLDEALAQPHVAARHAVIEAREGVAAVRTVASPVRLSATAPAEPRRSPRLGEHTEEVLSGAGYGAGDIARLREAGVIA